MRRALSYLEVLIAAAIALTGLLGVVAMFPVAILNMQKGEASDAAAAIGPSAMDQIPALGIDEPQRWLISVGGTWQRVDDPLDGTRVPRPEFRNHRWHPAIAAWDAYFIDPRFCSQVTTWDATQHSPAIFPAPLSANAADVRMHRVTLTNGDRITRSVPMSVAHSRMLFKVSDDLLFDRTDVAGQAQQDYIFNGAVAPQRRNYFGNFEWTIAVVPETIFDGSTGTIRQTGMCDVAAVVLHKRQTDLTEIITYSPAVPNEAEAERVVDVAQFYAGGLSGGDVQLQTRAGRPESDLLLHEGDWIMLSAMTYSPPGVPTPPVAGYTPAGPVFRWYKATSISVAYPNAGGFARDVTLEGSDWPVAAGSNTMPIPSPASAAAGTVTTRAVIVSGVVKVLEGRIQLSPPQDVHPGIPSIP